MEIPVDFLDITNIMDDYSPTENTPQVNFLNVKNTRKKSMRAEEVYKDLGDSEMVKFNV